MSEKFLERGKRQVRLRHAPAEGVAKLMAGHLNARFLTVLLQNKLDAGYRKSFATLGNENRPIISDRAAGEPIVKCGVCWRRKVDHTLPVSLSVHFQAGWIIIEEHTFQSEVVNFPYSQSAFEHEGEHGFVAFVMDDGKESFNLFFAGISRQRMRLAEEVSL